jgi:glc operon protein GlcG
MSHTAMLKMTLAAVTSAIALAAAAQQAPMMYGAPVNLETARKAAAAARAEATKKSWIMAIAVTDPAGNLVLFEKMDGTQTGSINIAIGKARSAAQFKRPTKVFQDLLAKGDNFTYLLGLEGAVPVQGGIPIVVNNQIVGAIGVSGGTGDQDTEVAVAGLAALK